MTFNLTYRRGSFPQSEEFASLPGAIARAFILMKGETCVCFQIEEGGEVVMLEAQLAMECKKANSN